MQVLLGPAPGNSPERTPQNAPQKASVTSATFVVAKAPVSPAIHANSKVSPAGGVLEANVTFRRDQAGRIYYVITDAQTGKELREVPPEAVRNVGEGIEEFLKQQEQAKQTQHVEAKA